MEQRILDELKEIKQFTLLGAKTAITMSDCSLLTGLSKSTLYKLVCLKNIPYYKGQGGKITYFDKDELTAWMLQNRVATSSELATTAAEYAATQTKKGGMK